MGRLFEEKVALVTGAASGIGQSTAMAFAAEGAAVVIADCNIKGAAETARHINTTGGRAIAVQVDVVIEDEVEAMISVTRQTFGRLDIAVNNAGIGGLRENMHAYPESNWLEVIDVNLNGVWRCIKHEIPLLRETGGGSIVNISSLAGIKGFPKSSAYCAAKHGVIGLTKSAALEYVKEGIRVNAVCPTFTDTPILDGARERAPELYAKMPKSIPIGRLANPEDIAGVIVFLCSENAAFVNGQSIPVDGGQTVA